VIAKGGHSKTSARDGKPGAENVSHALSNGERAIGARAMRAGHRPMGGSNVSRPGMSRGTRLAGGAGARPIAARLTRHAADSGHLPTSVDRSSLIT